jgi:hypothetical protein
VLKLCRGRVCVFAADLKPSQPASARYEVEYEYVGVQHNNKKGANKKKRFRGCHRMAKNKFPGGIPDATFGY